MVWLAALTQRVELGRAELDKGVQHSVPWLSSCRQHALCVNCAVDWLAALTLGAGAGQAELDKGVQRERALAEAEGRARENRENEDVNRRALAQRLEEERKKVVEAIDTTFRCRPGAVMWPQGGSLSSE